jgi:hypothetical protein
MAPKGATGEFTMDASMSVSALTAAMEALDARGDYGTEFGRIKDQIIATRAVTVEDATAQVMLAIGLLLVAQDGGFGEDETAEEIPEAMKLLYSALDALRAIGFLKCSDELADYWVTRWKSPWLDAVEAKRIWREACYPA